MSEINWTLVLGKIREEITSLASFVDQTKNGLDNLESTVRISSEKFPEASNQLSSVTGDLENAANNIMTILEDQMQEQDRAHEVINELTQWSNTVTGEGAEKCAAHIEELKTINDNSRAALMDLLTSMSFQDLTGQKLKKVIGSLGTIEEKLIGLADNFGLKVNSADKKGASGEVPIDQNIVDDLLKQLGRSA